MEHVIYNKENSRDNARRANKCCLFCASCDSKEDGFTLIEAAVSIMVISILIAGVMSLINLSLQLTSSNQAYINAVSIANQKMEIIRNMPYNSIGVVSGVPTGTIPQLESVTMGGDFRINNYIKYEDDPYDGVAGSGDTIINDYKIVTIKVSWDSPNGEKSVSVFSKIIPRTVETDAGLGVVKIYSVDSNGNPVPNADVNIAQVSGGVNVNDITDTDGILYYPLPQAFQDYKITVSKPGYESANSFDPAASAFMLTPIHLSVTTGLKTEESFSIDRLATLNITTVAQNKPENIQANPSSSRAETDPSIGADASGNIYVAWREDGDSTSSVMVRKFDSSKSAQWASALNISTSSNQSDPDIAVASSTGDAFVAWRDTSIAMKPLVMAESPMIAANPSTLKEDKSGFDIKRNLFSYFEKAFAIINKIRTQAIALSDLSPAGISAAGSATIVQSAKFSSVINNNSSASVSFNSPPTDGNVLIVVAIQRNLAQRTINTPSNASGNFTLAAYSNSAGEEMDVGIWYKKCGASEPSTVNVTSTGFFDGGIVAIMEVSGLSVNPLDVASVNDQTGSTGLTANTGSTGVSTAEGFAIAAIAFADNDFSTPNSSNYSSVSSNSWQHHAWQEWSLGNDASLAIATMNVTAAAAQRSTLTLSGGGSEQRNSALAVFKLSSQDLVSVTATGTQISSTTIPSGNFHIGGKFVMTSNATHNISAIKIKESGTVDADNSLSDIKLYYDIDTTAPYDCASESFSGTESQFGSATSFDGDDGKATFSGAAINISTTRSLCAYAMVDIGAGAAKDETVEISIDDPSVDVTVNTGAVTPSSPVGISGQTLLLSPALLNQYSYRWRNDDGDEASASWKADESSTADIRKQEAVRLRFLIHNNGSFDSAATGYRLEYGQKTAACAAIASWTALPTDDSAHWKIAASANMTDGDATTDSSGLTDPAAVFRAGQLKDAGNSTSLLTLPADEYTELEYSLAATNNATENAYCFRLTGGGSTAGFSYVRYAEASIVGDSNIYVAMLDSSGTKQWSAKRVNSDVGDADQENPSIATYDSATTTVVWEDYRNGNSDIYAQSFDASQSKLWAGDLQISNSAGNDSSPDVAYSSDGDILVAWVQDNDVYLQRYRSDGTAVWTNPVNISSSADEDYSPAIAADEASGCRIAWTERDGTGDYDTYLASIDNAGNISWKKNSNRSDSDRNQYLASVAFKGGFAYPIWTDDRYDGGDIMAQKIDNAGAYSWGEDQQINDDIGSAVQADPAAAAGSAPLAAWQDARNAASDIYFSDIQEPTAPVTKPNVKLRIYGDRKIYDAGVKSKYDLQITTNASGQYAASLGWDTYSIEASSTLSQFVTGCDPEACPITIGPAETKNITIIIK